MSKGNLRHFFLRQRILMRILCCAIAAICIPLMAVSTTLATRGRNEILKTYTQQSQAVANTAAEQFTEWLVQLHAVASSINHEPLLRERNITANTYGEMQAISMLQSYGSPFPYVNATCIYVAGNPDQIYTSDGKYDINVFFSKVIEADESIRQEWLVPQKHGTLFSYLNSNNTSGLAYSIPLERDGSCRRSCLFIMPGREITSTMATITGGDYHLAALYTSDGEVIYYNQECPFSREDVEGVILNKKELQTSEYKLFGSTIQQKFGALVWVPVSVYEATAGAFEHSARLVSTVNIFLCIAIIILLTYVSYQPLFHLMKLMGIKSQKLNKSEVDAISETYLACLDRMSSLEQERDEYTALMRGHMFEKLLNGDKVNETEYRLIPEPLQLGGNMFVAVTPLKFITLSSVLRQTLQAEQGVYFLEMKRDGYLAFFCYLPGHATRETLISHLQRIVDAPVGVGSCVTELQNIHTSYLESILAVDISGANKVMFYEKIEKTGSAELDLSMEMMQLARLIKNGDEQAKNLAATIFNTVEQHCSSLIFMRYTVFELMSTLRRSQSKMGIPLSAERAAQIVCHNSPEGIRRDFLREISVSLDRIRELSAQQTTSVTARIMELVKKEYTNYDFTLTTLAEAFDMTDYTVSRIFKEETGISFKKYVTTKRIEYAKELLTTTDDSVEVIATKSGFASASYFTRVFKAEENITPSMYRQRFLQT